jgi:hypothetical protein
MPPLHRLVQDLLVLREIGQPSSAGHAPAHSGPRTLHPPHLADPQPTMLRPPATLGGVRHPAPAAGLAPVRP